jgi:hypothetical protein
MFPMSLSVRSVAAVATAALLGASLVACATDPSKEVRDARKERVGDIREHNADTNEVLAKDAALAAESNVALDKDTSKLDDALVTKLDANAQRKAEAHEAVAVARKTFREDGGARIERADAKLAAVLFARAKPINHPAVANVRAQIVSVKASLSQLDVISDDSWFIAKKEVESNLAALESDVAKIGS